jgi:hypothetical protein
LRAIFSEDKLETKLIDLIKMPKFSLLVALETVILYLIIVIPLEYFLTEKYFILTAVDGRIKAYVFLTALGISLLLNFFLRKIVNFSWKAVFFVFTIFVASLIFGKQYSNYYSKLQQHPRIFSVNSNWSIQEMPIIINGKNFGPTWEPGKVLVDGMNFSQIEYWSENKIVVTAPVPSTFAKTYLKIVTAEGKESNQVNFEVRDPADL